jgi:hypothetical protein
MFMSTETPSGWPVAFWAQALPGQGLGGMLGVLQLATEA